MPVSSYDSTKRWIAIVMALGLLAPRNSLAEIVDYRQHLYQMAIVVHMHANIDRHRPYGSRQALIFLEQLLPEAPDVVVQIAHLAGVVAMTTRQPTPLCRYSGK